MKLHLRKIITSVVFSLSLSLVFANSANAACTITDPQTLSNPAEQLADIVCPVAAGLNILVLSAGAIFVMMIFWGSIKLSMSQGDAKGIESAKQLLTWAVIGFFCVIGVYGILAIILGIFGVNSILNLEQAINAVVNWINDTPGM